MVRRKNEIIILFRNLKKSVTKTGSGCIAENFAAVR